MGTQVLGSASTIFKYVYKVLGIVQFSYSKAPPTTKFSKMGARLWCVFSYGYFICICIFFHSARYDDKILIYVHIVVFYGTIVVIVVSLIMFHRRSDKIKILLIRIDDLSHTPVKKSTTTILSRVLLISCLIPVVVGYSLRGTTTYIIFTSCCTLITFDNFFLTDILDCLSEKFTAINETFRNLTSNTQSRRTNKVNLIIESVQNLSHTHYDLVILALQTTKQFEVTISLQIAYCFIATVDAIYTLITMTASSESMMSVRFVANSGQAAFSVCWFYTLVAKFSETQDTANAAALRLHEIWNKSVCRKAMGEKFRQLELVSIRMFNTQIRFNVCEFFNLDWKFCQLVIFCYLLKK